MSSLTHPSRLFDDAYDGIADGARALAKRPVSTGGLVVLAVAVALFIYMFPELQRYIRIKRM